MCTVYTDLGMQQMWGNDDIDLDIDYIPCIGHLFDQYGGRSGSPNYAYNLHTMIIVLV